jgi:hypothetical protein
MALVLTEMFDSTKPTSGGTTAVTPPKAPTGGRGNGGRGRSLRNGSSRAPGS